MRTFAREALAFVMDDIAADHESRTPFDLDLAGGFVHPAIRVGTWHVLVSDGFGERLDDDGFNLCDDMSLMFSVGRSPNLECDYNSSRWHDDQIACNATELVDSIRKMAERCRAADAERVAKLAKAAVYECSSELGVDGIEGAAIELAVWMTEHPDAWEDTGDDAANWSLTVQGERAWKAHVATLPVAECSRCANPIASPALTYVDDGGRLVHDDGECPTPRTFHVFGGANGDQLGALGDYIESHATRETAIESIARKNLEWAEVVQSTPNGLTAVWSSIA